MKSKILKLVCSLVMLVSINVSAQLQSDDSCISGNKFNVYEVGEVVTFTSNFGACVGCYYWEAYGATLLSNPSSGTVEVLITSAGPFDICNTFFDEGECKTCCETFNAGEATPECCEPRVLGYHNCLTNSTCHGGGVFQMYFDQCEADQFSHVDLFLPPSMTDNPNIWFGDDDQITIDLTTLGTTPFLNVHFCSDQCEGYIEIVAIFYYVDEQCEPYEVRHEIEAGCPCDGKSGERLINPKVYPNPVQSILNFSAEISNKEEDVVITVSDLNSGTIVSSKTFNTLEAGQFNTSLELSVQNNNAVYILSIESKNGLLYTEVIQQSVN